MSLSESARAPCATRTGASPVPTDKNCPFERKLVLALYDEDAYVQAPDGTQVQVKAVPINDGKRTPRQIVDSKQRKAIPAHQQRQQHPPLDEQMKQAKLRAQKMGVACDAIEWVNLLSACHVTIINSAVDLAKINGHMTALERGMVTVTQEDAMEQEIRATRGVTL